MAGYITVTVGQLPGILNQYALNGDRTVKTALTTAGLSSEGFEVQVDGRKAGLDAELRDGNTVLLLKKVKGN